MPNEPVITIDPDTGAQSVEIGAPTATAIATPPKDTKEESN